MGTEANEIRRRRKEAGVGGEDAETVVLGGGGELDLHGVGPLDVTEHGELHLRPGLASSRIDCGGAREISDVGAVTAATLIGGITNLDDIIAVLGSLDRKDGFLFQQGGTVRRGDLEAILVEDRDVGIDRDVLGNVVDAQTLDFDGDALAFLHADKVVVGFLRLRLRLDRDIHRNLLGCGEVVVRLDLVEVRELRYPEVPGIADPAATADAEVVLAQTAVRGDHEGDLDLAIVDHLEILETHPRLVEKDGLGVRKSVSDERHPYLRTGLAAAGDTGVEVGRSGIQNSPRCGKCRQPEGCQHPLGEKIGSRTLKIQNTFHVWSGRRIRPSACR